MKEEKQQFKAEETARCDKAIAAEKKKMENELQKLIKQNKKAMATEIEQAEQQIRQLQDQVSYLTEAKDNAETTVRLFTAHTKELTEQKKELEFRYKTQDSTLSEL
jgi:Na+/phosphate symporter